MELQKSLPAYVRQQVAKRVKNLQASYNDSRSLRPLIISLKNMCLKDGKMTPAQIEQLTSERMITNTVSHYINGTQDLVDIGILMGIYAKAVGGAESITLVYNAKQAVNIHTGQQGPMMTCMLCDDEPRTCGAYVPNFGQPSDEAAYVYMVCALKHIPPTSDPADQGMRDLVMERLKKATEQIKAGDKEIRND